MRDHQAFRGLIHGGLLVKAPIDHRGYALLSPLQDDDTDIPQLSPLPLDVIQKDRLSAVQDQRLDLCVLGPDL